MSIAGPNRPQTGMRGMGAVRTFVLAAVARALTVLAIIAAETAGGWIALWFLTGIAIAAIFTLPEAWVGQLAPEGSHGRPFALSALMAWVGLVLAPLTPQILAIKGPGLFILSAAGAVAACVPILLAPAVRLKGKPVVLSAERMGLRLMLRRVPTADAGKQPPDVDFAEEPAIRIYDGDRSVARQAAATSARLAPGATVRGGPPSAAPRGIECEARRGSGRSHHRARVEQAAAIAPPG